jgi:hypothetical protein
MTDANEIARKRGKEALRKAIDTGVMTRPPEFSDEALALRFAGRHTYGESEWREWLREIESDFDAAKF